MTIKPSWAVKAALGLLPLGFFAGNAFASVAPMGAPGGGDGDLVLAIIDTAAPGNSYEIDLGKTTLGLEGVNSSFSFSQSSSTDSSLAAFLSTVNSSDEIEYAVVGGSYDTTSATLVKSSANYLTTSATTPSSVINNTLAQFDGMDQTLYGNLNLDTGASSVNSYNTLAGTPDNFSDASGATTWYGKGPQNDADVGTSQGFYQFLSTYNSTSGSISAKNTAPATVTQIGSFDLALSGGAYTLTYTAGQTSPVPIPPAVWLLGSGLLGLAGVGRRRRAA